MAITPDDVRGLAEVVRGIPGDVVDLILQSPGGSPEAAESIVPCCARSQARAWCWFRSWRKSAATMIALAANEILMPISAELAPGVYPSHYSPGVVADVDGRQHAASLQPTQALPTRSVVGGGNDRSACSGLPGSARGLVAGTSSSLSAGPVPPWAQALRSGNRLVAF